MKEKHVQEAGSEKSSGECYFGLRKRIEHAEQKKLLTPVKASPPPNMLGKKIGLSLEV